MTKNQLSHVAFILDGNKRWAKKNKLSNVKGYSKGFENIKTIINHVIEKNIPNLTLFALSSENFKRPSISDIYDIINTNFAPILNELKSKNNIKIKIFGNRNKLPQQIVNIFKKAEDHNSNNTKLNLNIAFNYGFKEEIREVLKNYKKNIDSLDLEKDYEIRRLFYLGNKSDPDILIRTGGYKRLSNFIMYNLTYTELFFTDTLWPEFTIKEFDNIIHNYLNIDRKYGL